MNKFKLVKKTWRSTVDHNSKTGNSRKTCPFQSEFDELYGMRAGTRPSFTLSSMKAVPRGPAALYRPNENVVPFDITPLPVAGQSVNRQTVAVVQAPADIPPPPVARPSGNRRAVTVVQAPADIPPPPVQELAEAVAEAPADRVPKRKRPQPRKAATSVEWLEKYEERQGRRQQELMEQRQRMHDDKMKILKDYMDTLKKN